MFYFEILDFRIFFFYWNVNTIIVVDQTCEAVLNTSFIAILKNKLLFSPKLSVKVIGWADIRRSGTEERVSMGWWLLRLTVKILAVLRLTVIPIKTLWGECRDGNFVCGGGGVGKADWIFSDKEGFVLTVVSLQKKKILFITVVTSIAWLPRE